ncbi:hypothetical protein SELMODRAFT_414481, partial [Selaginella moellendorffii]
MLCLPCWAEQFFNTAWVVDTRKVGVRIKEDMEPKELRHAAKGNVQLNGTFFWRVRMLGGVGINSYTRNSAKQAVGFSLIAPALKNVIAASDFGYDETSPVRIADLGCVSGYKHNPCSGACGEAIRACSAMEPEIQAFFSDLSSNDFNTLFQLWRGTWVIGVVHSRRGMKPLWCKLMRIFAGSYPAEHKRLFLEELSDRETHATFCMPWLFRTIDEVVAIVSEMPGDGSLGNVLAEGNFSCSIALEIEEASMDSQPPHVLAFPFPTQGHINPMILLCRKLASMGFVVTFPHIGSKNMSSTADEQF